MYKEHDIKLPKEGSGKTGDLIKIDYIHAVEDYKSNRYPKESIRVTSSRKTIKENLLKNLLSKQNTLKQSLKR